jgi:transposase
VVNPARPKGFTINQLKRNKTDKLDSEVIAYFCELFWTPPRPEQRQLRDLVRYIDALIETRIQDLTGLR